jgi:hypothetical protein
MTSSARLAVALAVVAVLAVLGSAAITVAAYTGRDDAVRTPRAPDAHRSAGPGNAAGTWQPVGGDHGGAAFEVPPSRNGWTVQPRRTVLYYLDRHGQPAVGVTGAAVYRAGYCRGREESNRAFAGFAGSGPEAGAGASVRAVNTHLARRWVRAIALGDDLATSGPHTPLRTQHVTLADGTDAIRSASRVTVVRPGPCDAPAVDLAMVSIDTGGSVASVVLVRDSGAPGTLPGAAAEGILATLRPVGHPVRD